MILFFVFLLPISAYAIFILWCRDGWRQIPSSHQDLLRFPFITVIIPARNEEDHITACLESMSRQDFPVDKMEVFVVDDHSTDRTVFLVEQFRERNPAVPLKLVNLADHHTSTKKEAIRIAIGLSQGELIFTTDADCLLPATWIKTMSGYLVNNDAFFVAGPVSYIPGKSFTGRVQSLEMMGLIGITAAGIVKKKPIMCNGANLAYTRKVYLEAGGFESVGVMASGDDTQLMLKVADMYPEKIVFAKDPAAIVRTAPAGTIPELFSQRKRWAGKIPGALTPFTFWMALIAWLAHAALLVSGILLFSHNFPLLFFFFLMLVKIFPEILLLNSLSKFFGERKLLWIFLPAQPFYWLFIVLVGILVPAGTYRWKGRITR